MLNKILLAAVISALLCSVENADEHLLNRYSTVVRKLRAPEVQKKLDLSKDQVNKVQAFFKPLWITVSKVC